MKSLTKLFLTIGLLYSFTACETPEDQESKTYIHKVYPGGMRVTGDSLKISLFQDGTADFLFHVDTFYTGSMISGEIIPYSFGSEFYIDCRRSIYGTEMHSSYSFTNQITNLFYYFMSDKEYDPTQCVFENKFKYIALRTKRNGQSFKGWMKFSIEDAQVYIDEHLILTYAAEECEIGKIPGQN